jgi:hypothetical protein
VPSPLPHRFVRRAAAGLLLALLASGAEPPLPGNVRIEMRGLAGKVAEYLHEKNRKAIAVGTFANKSALPGNAGPGLARALAEELRNLKIRVEAKAGLEVGGEYFTKVDEKEDLQAVFVRAWIKDDQNKELRVLGRKIFGARAVASVLALTVDDLPQREEDRDAKIRRSVIRPAAAVQDTRALPGPKSPYAIEILVHGEPRKPMVKDGLAYVPLEKGEEYAVRLVNHSPYDAAVALTIDGLSVFAFSDREDAYTHILVPAGKTGLVKGWYRTDKTSDAFTITGYADSAAARALGDGSAVGAITAVFAAAWTDKPPDDEQERGPEVATGRGRPVDAAVEAVTRTVGRTRAAVSVRYAR